MEEQLVLTASVSKECYLRATGSSLPKTLLNKLRGSVFSLRRHILARLRGNVCGKCECLINNANSIYFTNTE